MSEGRQFQIRANSLEAARITKFEKRHRAKHAKDPHQAATGGMFAYEFNPTGIGTYVSIRCLSCHKKLDVTDSDCW